MSTADSPHSSITITSEEINLLIHAYLLDCGGFAVMIQRTRMLINIQGFVHTAYSLCSESRLRYAPRFKRHIPRGELVEILSKSLLYKEVEAHYKGGEQVQTCRQNFSLLEAHNCSSDLPAPLITPLPAMGASVPKPPPTRAAAALPSISTGPRPGGTSSKRKASPTGSNSQPEKKQKKAAPPKPSVNERLSNGEFSLALKGHDSEVRPKMTPRI